MVNHGEQEVLPLGLQLQDTHRVILQLELLHQDIQVINHQELLLQVLILLPLMLLDLNSLMLHLHLQMLPVYLTLLVINLMRLLHTIHRLPRRHPHINQMLHSLLAMLQMPQVCLDSHLVLLEPVFHLVLTGMMLVVVLITNQLIQLQLQLLGHPLPQSHVLRLLSPLHPDQLLPDLPCMRQQLPDLPCMRQLLQGPPHLHQLHQ